MSGLVVGAGRDAFFRKQYACQVCGRRFVDFGRALDHENGCKLDRLLREGDKWTWPRRKP